MELLVVIVFIAVLFIMGRDKKLNNSQKDLKQHLISMNPRDFEFYCADLFKRLGYKSQVTKATADGGKDIILKSKTGTTYVEVKHYSGSVGRPIAQKLKGAMSADNVNNGIIITTGYFTNECIQYCRQVGILCYDLKDILQLADKGKEYALGTGFRREARSFKKALGRAINR